MWDVIKMVLLIAFDVIRSIKVKFDKSNEQVRILVPLKSNTWYFVAANKLLISE